MPNKWISVEDKPHPINENFVAYYKNNTMSTMFWNSKDSDILYWMEIPDVPVKTTGELKQDK